MKRHRGGLWRWALAGLAAAIVAAWAVPAARDVLAPAPAFEPVRGLEGFRRLAGGPVSTGPGAALVGVGAAPGPADGDGVPADLCRALFGAAPGPGVVPVASFSDYACPYCRVLDERVAALDARPGVAVRWHELPLLGAPSEVAARAALAAERQGGYGALHARLMRAGFQTTPAYVEAAAAEIGLDPARLTADMDGPEVAERLAESWALARAFGLVGTPALVVGRTLVVGEIGERALDRLVESERALGPPPACRG